MNKNNIVIVDYTLGNLYGVKRAFQKVGYEPLISDKKKDILNAQKIVLPGVGAFSAGMKGLEEKDLLDSIKDFAKTGKPILGICLGMQLLMTQSEENGLHEGMNLIKGKVKKFDPPKETNSFKIPHYGWSSVSMPELGDGVTGNPWRATVLDGVAVNSFFYFVHSYYVHTDDPLNSIGVSNYGRNIFTSVLKKGNISGCQFHPELSGERGLQIITNFVSQKY